MRILLILFAVFLGLSESVYSQATGFVDLKFGRYQIADSQWNVSSCTTTSTCQIYSTQPGTMYKIPWTNGQWAWQAGQYLQFVASGNASYPWTGNVYNSDGSLAGTIGAGKVISMGTDANGKSFFFFMGSDNNTGQLFSTNTGLSGSSGYTWTGTLNPTNAQLDTFAAQTGSTSPLASGQSYSAGPTVVGGTISQTNAPANQIITSGGSSTAGITVNQQTRVNAWTSKIIVDNTIYIDQIGDNNNITVVQIGNKNLVDGIGQQAAQIQGNQNTLTINQGVTGAGQNQVSARIIGDSNNINLGQARDNLAIATGTNGHYQSLDIDGNSNVVTTQQTNSGGVGGHYMETTVIGNSNNIINKQLDNGNKIMFATVNGNNNSATVTQQGTGQHYSDVKLTGNGNSAIVTQSGTSQNKATIDLTNAGGPATLNLNQNGGMNFSITQSCMIAGGCTTTVSQ